MAEPAYWRIVPGPGGGCPDIYRRRYTTAAHATDVQQRAQVGPGYVVVPFTNSGKRIEEDTCPSA